ncbi:DUF3180 domain-containing protein [Arthrobacter pigmenti]
MSTIRTRWLILVAAFSALAGYLLSLAGTMFGWPTPVLPLSSLFTMAVIAGFTLVLGIRVLRWRQGKRQRQLNLILAARTLVLAHACAYAGCLLLGWHIGILVDQLPLWSFRSDHTIGFTSLAMTGGGLVMIVIGLVVERFCRIPPEDNEESDGSGGHPKGEGEYA